MAKRLFTGVNITFAATAAGSQATRSGYMSILGTSATQTTDILEILVSGMASASTISAFLFARQGTVGTGGADALVTPNSDGPMHPATAALGSVVTVTAGYVTNQVIPSNAITDARINLGLNSFGGILRWNAAPTQQFTLVGNAAPGGAGILWNNLTPGASSLANAHIMYETY